MEGSRTFFVKYD